MFPQRTLRAVRPRKTVSRPAKQVTLETRRQARLEQRRRPEHRPAA